MAQEKLLILEAFTFTLESVKYAEAERNYQLKQSGVELVDDEAMRVENELLKKKIELLESQVKQLSERVTKLEISGTGDSAVKVVPAPAKPSGDSKKVEDDDEDVDLFGSDEEDDEAAAKLKEERLAAYAAKKSKKPALVAKSNVILDIKPWDDETDMKELENQVRTIQMEGLLWGSSKLVPVAFGVKKLQISTVVEDDKVSVEELTDKIEAFEDFVQSVDIAAFNKI